MSSSPASSSSYRLLQEFRRLFEGQRYNHRDSTRGDWVAMHLYEDLVSAQLSSKLAERVAKGSRVYNSANLRRGIRSRRGDGSFGQIVPGIDPIRDPGYAVLRGAIATIEIGVEVKIVSKAMVRQIGRVLTDLRDQVTEFRKGGENPICVGIVGINWAETYTSYEGSDRAYETTGTGRHLHPFQEAAKIEARLRAEAQPYFDEFLILHYRATNSPPFPFAWVDERAAALDCGALLVRVSRKYDQRF